MKTLKAVLLLTLACSANPLNLWANESHSAESAMMEAPAVVAADAAMMGGQAAAETVSIEDSAVNKICPISGHEIGAMGEGKEVEYKGKKIMLCCAMCEKDFNKDPEKFSKMVEEQMGQAAGAEPTAEQAKEAAEHIHDHK